MKRLKCDKVISSTDLGDLVGVYWADTDGSEVIFELPKDDAQELVKLWNEAVYFTSCIKMHDK